jgi:hypothetical protein
MKMQKRFELVAVLILSLFSSASSPAVNAKNSPTVQAARQASPYDRMNGIGTTRLAESPKMLVGGVEHSEALGTVDERYRAGKRYLKPQVGKFDSATATWYRIPNWMAGWQWVTEQETETYVEDFDTQSVDANPKTKNFSAHETHGWQKDKNGDVWEIDPVPYVTTASGDGVEHVFVHRQPVEVIKFSPDRIVFRFYDIDLEVDKSTKRITEVVQHEGIERWTRVSDGVIRGDISTKSFDPDGKPLRLRKAFRIARLEEPFKPWDTYQGHDCRLMFYQFLAGNGMSELIPSQKQTAESE